MTTPLAIGALLAAARDAWPGVEVPAEAFAEWLARTPEGAESLRTDELYLTCACARGDQGAMRILEGRYFGAIGPAVARFGPPTFADDVKQELRQRLFVDSGDGTPRIAAYSGRGGLQRWLRAVAVRIALNLTRGKKNQPHALLGDADLLDSGDPELAHLKSRYGAEFKQAFADALASLTAELQTFLRLYYLDDLDLAEIAAVYQVSAPTVSRRLHSARTQVFEATRKLMKERLKVSGEELDSIMRLIQSRLSMEQKPLAIAPDK